MTIDLPTVIALFAPVLLLVVVDRVICRVLARRRSRSSGAPIRTPAVLGPPSVPITPRPSTQAPDRAVVDARRAA